MNKIKFLGWDKCPRTMIWHIKPGDIFLFELREGAFGMGRIISEVDIGHVAEIFDAFSATPGIRDIDVASLRQAMSPVILDSHSLLDRKTEGESRYNVNGRLPN